MTWLNNLNNAVFEIITGDGKSYKPKWLNASKEVEFNISEFTFIDVDGSLVTRKTSKGRTFPLEFYFDGENSVDIGNAFELSSRDVRRWTLKHPFYGQIKCQPIRLRQDNTKYNVSKFTVNVIETLLEGYPKPVEIPEDLIISNNAIANELQAAAFENNGEFDRNTLTSVTNQYNAVFSNIIDDPIELNDFKALVDNSLNVILNTASTATQIIRSMQAYINYPATIVQTVEARYNTFKEALNLLIASVSGIASNFRDQATKNQFEAIGGALISASQVAVSTNITDDYETRETVIAQQLNLLEDFENYIIILDENQTDRSDTPDSYVPNFDGLNAVAALASLTNANLFEIAFEAKQVRVYVNDKDSNPIVLCHKFYGLDQLDENLNDFIRINNILLNEILQLKKGREIIYYI